jgi:uncharacterized membrane protein
MKKKLFLFLSAIVVALGVNAQSKGELSVIKHPETQVYSIGMSTDGNEVVGYIGFNSHSYSWTKAGGMVEFDDGIAGSSAAKVSDNGIIVGQFADSNYMYEEPDLGMIPVLSAGFYVNGKWHSLGIKTGVPLNSSSGSMAEAISSDGTIIGGSQYNTDGNMLVPTKWTISGENIADTKELEYEMIGQGARVQAVSADGTVFGGWAAPYRNRQPVVWVNDRIRYITLDGFRLEGEVFGISPNGKFAALQMGVYAAVYDIENDKLNIIGKKDGVTSATAQAVSDNGYVVGYNLITMRMDREAFIYHEHFGMIPLPDYLEDLGISNTESISLLTPMAISTDGSKITGFGYIDYEMYGWYIDITEHLSGFNAPMYLTAEEKSYGNIELNWHRAKSDGINTLSGYNIYRNGEKINTALTTDTTHTDNLPNGSYVYTVTAVWNNTDESNSSNEAKVNTALVALPFFDDFSSSDLDAKYWNTTSGLTGWDIIEGAGINPPCASFTSPKGGQYSSSLITSYLNAQEATEVSLSFNISIPVDWEKNMSAEHLAIEIFDGTNWNEIDILNPVTEGYGAFEPKKYDISQWAAGNDIRIRFTAYGTNIGGAPFWSVDNVSIFTPEDAFLVEVPLHVSAHRTETGEVHVNWADPGDIVNLSYLPEDGYSAWIHNEGESFLAVNMFDAQDLTNFNGYKLTSISAYLSRMSETATPVEYKLIAFKGTERVLYQDITSYESNAWNTFELTTPLIIDASKPLYFGLEIGTHDIDDQPLGLCTGVLAGDYPDQTNVNDGRSNLISYDNGSTWHKLTEYSYDDGSPMLHSLAIKAIIAGGDNAVAKDRLMGYRIYRDGEDILGVDWDGSRLLTVLNNYTDMDAPSDEICYQVSAFYTTQEESEKSGDACVEEYVSITEPNKNSIVDVYPNPTNNVINLTKQAEKILVYDIRGVILNTLSNSRQVDLNAFPAGMYFLKITADNNQTTVKKVIKK